MGGRSSKPAARGPSINTSQGSALSSSPSPGRSIEAPSVPVIINQSLSHQPIQPGIAPSASSRPKEKRTLFGWLRRSKSKRGSKEIAVDSLDGDAVIGPEQIFAASAAAFQESRLRSASSHGSSLGQKGSTSAQTSPPALRSRSMSATLPSLDNAISDLSQQHYGNRRLSGSAHSEQAERAALAERAKSIGASIARAVEQEGVSAFGATLQGALSSFRAYGENEVHVAAVALEEALSAPPPPKAKKTAIASTMELVAKVRREEGMRAAQFMAFVNRAAMGLGEQDQMAAVRDYATMCSKLIEQLMSSLPTMPPSMAPAVSSYLSHLAQHKKLAMKALSHEDPHFAAAEAEARKRASVSRAKSAATLRDAGISRPTPVSRAKAARDGAV